MSLNQCMTPDYQLAKADAVRDLARRIEEDLYRRATSLAQYYELLANKIYKLSQATTTAPRMTKRNIFHTLTCK